MSAFVTDVQLQDHFSAVVYDISNAVDFAVSCFANFQDAIQMNLNASSVEKIGIQAESAAAALDEMNEAIHSMPVPEMIVQSLNGLQEESLDERNPAVLDHPVTMGAEGMAEFESMSAAISQMKTELQNAAAGAISPVMQSLNEIANSQAFQSMVNTALQGLWTLANSEALQVFMGRVNQLIDTINGSGIFQALVNGAVIAFQG